MKQNYDAVPLLLALIIVVSVAIIGGLMIMVDSATNLLAALKKL